MENKQRIILSLFVLILTTNNIFAQKAQESYYCVRDNEFFNCFYLKDIGMITALHCVHKNLNAQTNQVTVYIPSSDKKERPKWYSIPIIKVLPQFEIAILDVSTIPVKLIPLNLRIIDSEYLRDNSNGESYYKIKATAKKTEYDGLTLNFENCLEDANVDEDGIIVKNWLRKRKSGFELAPIIKYKFGSFEGLSGCPIITKTDKETKKTNGIECVGMHLGENNPNDSKHQFQFAIAFTKEVIDAIKKNNGEIDYQLINQIYQFDLTSRLDKSQTTALSFQSNILSPVTKIKGGGATQILTSLIDDINLNFPFPKTIEMKYHIYIDCLMWPSNRVSDLGLSSEYVQARTKIKQSCPCKWSFAKLYCFESILRKKKYSEDEKFWIEYNETLEECKMCLTDGVPKKLNNYVKSNGLNQKCMEPITENNLSVLITKIEEKNDFDNLLEQIREGIKASSFLKKAITILSNASLKFSGFDERKIITLLSDSIKEVICDSYSLLLSKNILKNYNDSIKQNRLLLESKAYCSKNKLIELDKKYLLNLATPKNPIELNSKENLTNVLTQINNKFLKKLSEFERAPEYFFDNNYNEQKKQYEISITYGESSDTNYYFGNSYWNFRPGKYIYDEGEYMNNLISDYLIQVFDSLVKNQFISKKFPLSLQFDCMADGIPFNSTFIVNSNLLYLPEFVKNYSQLGPKLNRKDDNYNLAYARGSHLAKNVCETLKSHGINLNAVEIFPTTTNQINEFGNFRKVKIKLMIPLKVGKN
jgi:hypothetical protein